MATVAHHSLSPQAEGEVRALLARLNYHSQGVYEVLEYIGVNGFAEGCLSLAAEDVPAVETIIEAHDWDAPRYSGRWAIGPEGRRS